MVTRNEEREGAGAQDAERDLDVARTLGQYLDMCAGGEDTNAVDFVSSHPRIAPELALELRTLDEISSILEDKEPTRMLGDFEILREAGRGGMGIVYEARQVSLDRRVALKVLPPGVLADRQAVARFRREARVAGRFQHPNIVPVYSMGVEAGTPYFAMEFCTGETLHQIQKRMRLEKECPREAGDPPGETTIRLLSALTRVLERGSSSAHPPAAALTGHGSSSTPGRSVDSPSKDGAGASSLEEVDRLYCLQISEAFAGAAEGLHHAHTRGVIHRDLKPSNLILDESGRLRILDFGLAWQEDQSSLTLTWQRLGTPLYMSPEQVQARGGVFGPATDIYSLGATLYEMLAWRPPFGGRSPQETMDDICRREPPSLRKANPHVPHDIETIVLKCLEKDPRARYGTAEALAQDLRRFVRGEVLEARPQPLVSHLSRRAWRARRRIVPVAIAALLLAGIFVARHVTDMRQREKAAHGDGLRDAAAVLTTSVILARSRSLGLGMEERIPLAAVDEDGSLRDRYDGGLDGLVEGGGGPFWAGPMVVDASPDVIEETVERLGEDVAAFPMDPIGRYQLARGLVLLGRRSEARTHLVRALDLDPRSLPALSLLTLLLEEEGSPEAAAAGAALEKLLHAEDGVPWHAMWHEARKAEAERDWEKAVKAYDRLAASGGDDEEHYPGYRIETLLGRGIARLRAGELDGAGDDFAISSSELRGRFEPTVLQGKVYCLKENVEKAAEVFARAFERGPPLHSERVAAAIAVSYEEVGEFEKALAWSVNAGEKPAGLRLRAEILARLGRNEEALAVLSRVTAEDPRDLTARILQGNIHLARGAYGAAESAYSEAEAIAPSDARPLLARAVLLETQNRLGEARSALNEALKRDPGLGQSHYDLGRVLGKQGDAAAAKRSYERAIVADPGNALAYNNLGTLLDLEEDLDGALVCYQRAVKLAPLLGLAHFNHAWALHRQRRLAEAAEEYRQAIRLGSGGAEAHNNLGACLQFEEKLEEASAEYKMAIRLDPANPRAYHSLGTALRRQNDLASAIASYRSALARAPRWTNARNDLGRALQLLDRFDEALGEFEKVLDLDPQFVWASNNMAELYLRHGLPLPTGKALSGLVRRLEGCVSLPGASPDVACLLARCRAGLSPLVASPASVDAIVDRPVDLIPDGAIWDFFRGFAEPSPGLEWTEPSPLHDDGAWESGPGAFGCGAVRVRTRLDRDDRTECFTTFYVRRQFVLEKPEQVARLILSVENDDGCVVYLNGQEVSRMRAWDPGKRLPFDAVADEDEYRPWLAWDLALALEHLRAGENSLAIMSLCHSRDAAAHRLNPVLRADLIPAAKGERIGALRESLDAFRAAAGPGDEAALSYFEGRLLELEGRLSEAIKKYEEAAEVDASIPEPFLRIATLLGEENGAAAAERCLRDALGRRDGPWRNAVTWDAWFRVAVAGGEMSPAEAFARFPRLPPEPPGERHDRPDRPADLHWLCGRLARKEAIQINCGGGSFRAADGASWGRDRFFCGGLSGYLPATREEGAASRRPERARLQTERCYYEPSPLVAGYCVPLPRGRYRVVLHFVERTVRRPGDRRFDVLLEGETVLSDWESSRAGFGLPDTRALDVEVQDGALNVDFLRRAHCPHLAGLEIVPLRLNS